MKKVFIILAAVAAAAFCQIVISPPLYGGPSITLYGDGAAPQVYGAPAVCQSVTILYSGKTVSSAEVRGDSLVVFTSLDTSGIRPLSQSADIIGPIYYGPSVIFNKTGIYQAYEVDISGPVILIYPPPPPVYVPLGEFTILPLVEATPAKPTVNDSISLFLVLGQTLADPCVAYSGTAVVKDSAIFLSWQELGLGRPCLDTLYTSPVKYGPVFRLGRLSAGNYSVYVDDTVLVGTLRVNGILIVNGSVTVMKHPLSRMMSVPVPGALVTAVKAPQCPNWWGGDPFVPDTVTAITDAAGAFTLYIPNTLEDYEITVTKAGFHPQALFTNNYPVMESYPPRENVSFELLQDSILPETGLTVTATYNGTPIESVSVSLYGGREMLICPMYDMLAKAAAQTNAYGYTDKNGKLVLTGLSMSPYIDYVYSAYRYIRTGSLTQNGVIRLNKYWDNTLNIELGTIATEVAATPAKAPGLAVSPNPFNPSVTIAFANPGKKADLSIYAVDGRQVKSFKNIRGTEVSWNAQGLPAGVYVLKARVDGKVLTRKLILAK